MVIIIEKLDENIESSVFSVLKKINYRPKKKKVIIKPNIVGAFLPDDPYITNPRIVGGIIDYLQFLGLTRIYICEGAVDMNMDRVFKISGYEKLAREKNVSLIDVYKCKTKKFRYKFGTLDLPKLLFDSEYINVAKLKTHAHTLVSLCIKNQKGLLPMDQKKLFHKNLNASIAELYKIIKPDLAIIDGTNGVEGNGPGQTGKTVKNLNLLIAGNDALKVDILATKLIGLNPEKAKHLMLIKKSKKIIFSDQTLDMLKKYQLKFEKPSEYLKSFSVYYWHNEKACSGCSTMISRAKHTLISSPKYWLRMLPYTFFKRLDILVGEGKIPSRHGKIICLGDCTKKLSKRNKSKFIGGCPPKVKDFLDAL